jgi:putative membrane protein insertion efficiency factor
MLRAIIKLPTRLARGLIALYKRFLSPLLPPACRFHPTCSQYCSEALEVHGFFKGGWLGMTRLLRCNPFCKGGHDPVPERKGPGCKPAEEETERQGERPVEKQKTMKCEKCTSTS